MSNLRSLRQMGSAEIDSIVSQNEWVIDGPTIARRKLLGDLRALGVKPFKQEDVDDYKAKVVAVTDFMYELGRMLAKMNRGTFMTLTLAFVIGASIAEFQTNAEIGVWWLLAQVIVGVVVTSLLMLGGFLAWKTFAGSHWDWTELHLYVHHLKRTVPPRVHQLAARIQQARPDVGLKVEYFQLDPFLVVYDHQHPDVFYTVAVWDEHGFRTTDS